ncbi:hypothetical protein D3C86_1361390 [compost metagenome]
METETFCDQAQANHQQEAQTQDHNRRMFVHKTRQRLRRQQHHGHCNHYRGHHYRQMVHHADSGNHRIQREDSIKHHNLRDNHPETRIPLTVSVVVLSVFQPFMQLGCCFE